MISNLDQIRRDCDVARRERDAAEAAEGVAPVEITERYNDLLKQRLAAEEEADLGKPTMAASVPTGTQTQQAATPAPIRVAAPLTANLTVNGRGLAEASLPNLVKTLTAQQQTTIGFDTFRGCVMISRDSGQNWARLTDNDMKRLRETIERELRYAAIGKDIMRDAVDIVADNYKFDSAIKWLDQQQWDETPRVDRFLHDYCGCPLDEYTIAVSRFIWSGLASRVYEPGGQLDMVIGMLSKEQGFHKSSALAEIVPDPEFFTDALDLHKDDDNFKRIIRGKLVCEIAELAGLNTASVEHIKRVITRRVEEWIEKWQTIPTRYARRCMLFATTNIEQFLPLDESGQRRWLPIEVGRINREPLKRDRGQLWAEGAHIYRIRKLLDLPGVAYEDAERLAKGRHAKHEQTDVWEPAIEKWLATPTTGPDGTLLPAPCERPFTIFEVLRDALMMNRDRMDKKAEKRAAGVLKLLGYSKKEMRVAGERSRYWQKA